MSDEPRKILLVDDDRLQFLIIQGLFRKIRGGAYQVDWAGTYDEGLVRLMSGNYAACLLDYRLDNRDGLELLRDATAKGSSIPIVFLTSETATQVDVAAMEAGAQDYLVKGEITASSLDRSLRYALKLGETLAALRDLATRDQLTGLLNRREFDRILDEECERAARFNRPLALVLLDIDHFKNINDTHGHPFGDAVLREVSRRLAATARTVDRVTRFGGEEFGIVLLETDREAALGAARRICAAVAASPISVEGMELAVTISAGTAVMTPGDRRPESLVSAADRALYAAKAGGRNRAHAAWDL